MVASASEKFELAKTRAIYGTQPKAYVLSIMEPALSQRIDVKYGLEAGLSLKRCVSRMPALKDMPWTAMLDYTDFNIQHSLHIQAYVFDSLSKMFSDWLYIVTFLQPLTGVQER
ncbi:hypothetical protein GJ496_009389 [Pomphorhynchus laevis]|nr:hypothetical protein GJ496_009389 [Pomphorhynchus laevis]